MGVDFYPCSKCKEVYADCGDYVTCSEDTGGCGRDWCSDGCAEEDGYIKCSCKLGKELDQYEAYCEDGCEKYNDSGDTCLYINCEHLTKASWDYCRKESFEDNEILEYALCLLNKSKEDLIFEMKNR